jgi:D-xylose transport system ATP-binding protein
MSDGAPLVEMRDIHLSFGGIKAVDGASVDLHPGEVVGLLGHNGAGKSTLIKVLSGAYRADSGEIRVDREVAQIASPATPSATGSRRSTRPWPLPTTSTPPPTSSWGGEIVTPLGMLDDAAMEEATRQVMGRPQPAFPALQGSRCARSRAGSGSRSRSRAAIHFNAAS